MYVNKKTDPLFRRDIKNPTLYQGVITRTESDGRFQLQSEFKRGRGIDFGCRFQ